MLSHNLQKCFRKLFVYFNPTSTTSFNLDFCMIVTKLAKHSNKWSCWWHAINNWSPSVTKKFHVMGVECTFKLWQTMHTHAKTLKQPNIQNNSNNWHYIEFIQHNCIMKKLYYFVTRTILCQTPWPNRVTQCTFTKPTSLHLKTKIVICKQKTHQTHSPLIQNQHYNL